MPHRPALNVAGPEAETANGAQTAKYLKGVMKYSGERFKYLKGIYHMPKYLKGFKSGRSSGLAPDSPRAWSPFLRSPPQDWESGDILTLGPAP